jgi:Uri superfamily endonuclease
MDKGVYALVFSNRPCSLRIGALGEIPFRRGWHIYIGSATGPGGFARVRRHRHLARSRDRPPRWHVDHILLSPRFTLRYALCGPSPGNLECTLAGALGGEAVPSFGSSDCTCRSHLLYRDSDPVDEVKEAMASLGLVPLSTIL